MIGKSSQDNWDTYIDTYSEIWPLQFQMVFLLFSGNVIIIVPLNITFQTMFHYIVLLLLYMDLPSHCLPFLFLTPISKMSSSGWKTAMDEIMLYIKIRLGSLPRFLMGSKQWL